jgi:membrane-bound lytic murein transglycosylase D
MIIIAKNPKQYGLTDLVPDAPVLSDTVTTDYAIDMRLVADLTDSTVADVVALNPALLRLSTPTDIPYDLHIPVGTKAKYLDRIKDIPESNRASWRFHVVKAGETIDQVATSYHSHPAEIAELNELKPGAPLEDGDELVIPVAAIATSHGQSRYTTRRGDTLVTVADRFGVSVEQLRDWNHLSASRITPGRSLAVAEPLRLAPGGRSARSRRGAHASAARGGRNARAASGRARGGSASSNHVHASAHSASKKSSGGKRRR